MRLTVHEFKGMSDLGFDPEAYSKFKYGSSWEAFVFGIELGKKLGQWVKETCSVGDTVMISGAPYNKIPIASTALAKYACMWLQSNCRDVKFDTFKIDRDHSYDVDYGKMSASEREELISSDVFRCDVNHLKGKKVVFVDDIVITGAHERNMEKMVDEIGLDPSSVAYAYYAALEDSNCCPSIESDLNYAYIQENGANFKNFVETAKVTHNNLILNTRATKFILSMDADRMEEVVNVMEARTLRDLAMYSHANGYHTNPKYEDNCRFLKDRVIR